MFRLLRFFALTSATAVVAVVVVLVVLRQHQVDELIAFAESQNVALARSFANTIWPRFASYVASTPGLDGDALRAHSETRSIHLAVKAISAGLPVLKIKIYNLEGLTVFSSEPAQIGADKSNNPGYFSAAREGKPSSKLTFRNTFSSFEGTVQDRDLVESYLPIRRGDGPVEGVFELYSDVTPLVAATRKSTIELGVGLLVIFGLLYAVLFLIVRRADLIIKRQHTDITEKNLALEHEVAERKQVEAALKRARDNLEQRVEERTRALMGEIVERKRAEEEVRRQRNELAHVGGVIIMGEMATSLAHELNQPLTVISGCAQYCIDALRGNKGGRDAILDAMTQVAEQAERADEIIRRVRGFIHKEDPVRKLIDVNATIGDLSGLLRSDAREYGAAISIDLGERLPPVLGDPIQIQQVVLNLAHNGMEAMSGNDPASRHLAIQTSAPRNNGVEIAVRDQGPGVPAEALERVFDPFFTTKASGLGMGLAISRSIVEAHGGTLWVVSNGEDGTTVFHFTLPAAKEGKADDP